MQCNVVQCHGMLLQSFVIFIMVIEIVWMCAWIYRYVCDIFIYIYYIYTIMYIYVREPATVYRYISLRGGRSPKVYLGV